jgi:hypothetical protein
MVQEIWMVQETMTVNGNPVASKPEMNQETTKGTRNLGYSRDF